MAIETRIRKADAPDDILRCQRITGMGQCPNRKIEDSEFCDMHTGRNAKDMLVAREVRNYKLTKWQHRLNEFANSPTVKTLRDEIGILRMTAEALVNMCQDENDFLIYSSKINETMNNIRATVESCHKMEDRLGFTLDRSAAINLSEKIIAIVSNAISDPQTLETVADGIAKAILETGKQKALPD